MARPGPLGLERVAAGSPRVAPVRLRLRPRRTTARRRCGRRHRRDRAAPRRPRLPAARPRRDDGGACSSRSTEDACRGAATWLVVAPGSRVERCGAWSVVSTTRGWLVERRTRPRRPVHDGRGGIAVIALAVGLRARRHRGRLRRGAPARPRGRRVRPRRRRPLVRRGRCGLARFVCLRRLRARLVPGHVAVGASRRRRSRVAVVRPPWPVTPGGCGRAATGRAIPVVAVLGVVVAAELGYLLALALFTPPTEYDVLTYHLTRAILWIQQGSVGPIPGVDGHADQRPPARRGDRAGSDDAAVRLGPLRGPRAAGRRCGVAVRRRSTAAACRHRIRAAAARHSARWCSRPSPSSRCRRPPRSTTSSSPRWSRRRPSSPRALAAPRSGTGVRSAASSSERRRPASSRPPCSSRICLSSSIGAAARRPPVARCWRLPPSGRRGTPSTSTQGDGRSHARTSRRRPDGLVRDRRAGDALHGRDDRGSRRARSRRLTSTPSPPRLVAARRARAPRAPVGPVLAALARRSSRCTSRARAR